MQTKIQIVLACAFMLFVGYGIGLVFPRERTTVSFDSSGGVCVVRYEHDYLAITLENKKVVDVILSSNEYFINSYGNGIRESSVSYIKSQFQSTFSSRLIVDKESVWLVQYDQAGVQHERTYVCPLALLSQAMKSEPTGQP